MSAGVMVDHYFQVSRNPLRQQSGSCERCGRLNQYHPEPPLEVYRIPEWEVQVTEAAADGIVDPGTLNGFAGERALAGPLAGFAERDFDQEVREELADARNYICWAIQRDQHFEPESEDTDVRRVLRVRALGQIAAAFHLIEQARSL